MPVESRIRSALAEQAAEVRVDVEQPLEQRAPATSPAARRAVGGRRAPRSSSARSWPRRCWSRSRSRPSLPDRGRRTAPARRRRRSRSAGTPARSPSTRRSPTASRAGRGTSPLRRGRAGAGRHDVPRRRRGRRAEERLGGVVRRRGRPASDPRRRQRSPSAPTVSWTSRACGSTATGCGYHFDWDVERGRLSLETITGDPAARDGARCWRAAPGSGSASDRLDLAPRGRSGRITG